MSIFLTKMSAILNSPSTRCHQKLTRIVIWFLLLFALQSVSALAGGKPVIIPKNSGLENAVSYDTLRFISLGAPCTLLVYRDATSGDIQMDGTGTGCNLDIIADLVNTASLKVGSGQSITDLFGLGLVWSGDALNFNPGYGMSVAGDAAGVDTATLRALWDAEWEGAAGDSAFWKKVDSAHYALLDSMGADTIAVFSDDSGRVYLRIKADTGNASILLNMDGGDKWEIKGDSTSGNFIVRPVGGSDRFTLTPTGLLTLTSSILGVDSLDLDSGLYISDDITITGTVDGVDVSDLNDAVAADSANWSKGWDTLQLVLDDTTHFHAQDTLLDGYPIDTTDAGGAPDLTAGDVWVFTGTEWRAVDTSAISGGGSIDSAILDFGAASYKSSSDKAWSLKFGNGISTTTPTDSGGIDTTTISSDTTVVATINALVDSVTGKLDQADPNVDTAIWKRAYDSVSNEDLYVHESGDTMSGNLHLYNNFLLGIPDPSIDSHAVNLKYLQANYSTGTHSLDSAIIDIGGGTYKSSTAKAWSVKAGTNVTFTTPTDSAGIDTFTISAAGAGGTVDSAMVDFGGGTYKSSSDKAWSMKAGTNITYTTPTDSAGIDTFTISASGAGTVDSALLDFGGGTYKSSSDKAWSLKFGNGVSVTAPTDSGGIDTTTISADTTVVATINALVDSVDGKLDQADANVDTAVWREAYDSTQNLTANYAPITPDSTEIDSANIREWVADKVGEMVTGNTETGITVTYEDGDNTLDFVVTGGGGLWDSTVTGSVNKYALLDSEGDTAIIIVSDTGAGAGEDTISLFFGSEEGEEAYIRGVDQFSVDTIMPMDDSIAFALPGRILWVDTQFNGPSLITGTDENLTLVAETLWIQTGLGTAWFFVNNILAGSGSRFIEVDTAQASAILILNSGTNDSITTIRGTWLVNRQDGVYSLDVDSAAINSYINTRYVAKVDSGTWDEVSDKLMLNQASLGNASDSGETDSAIATLGFVKAEIENAIDTTTAVDSGNVQNKKLSPTDINWGSKWITMHIISTPNRANEDSIYLTFPATSDNYDTSWTLTDSAGDITPSDKDTFRVECNPIDFVYGVPDSFVIDSIAYEYMTNSASTYIDSLNWKGGSGGLADSAITYDGTDRTATSWTTVVQNFASEPTVTEAPKFAINFVLYFNADNDRIRINNIRVRLRRK